VHYINDFAILAIMASKDLNIPSYTSVYDMDTTIKLHLETKAALDEFRQYKNESYDEVIRKIIYVAKNIKKQPELSKKTIKDIEDSRERIRKGEFYTEAKAMKRLGIKCVK
jgi:hypothetical protein